MKFIKLIFVLASILALAGLTVATERRRHMKRKSLTEGEKKDLESYIKLANDNCKKDATGKDSKVTLAEKIKNLLTLVEGKDKNTNKQIREAFENLKNSQKTCDNLKTFQKALKATLVKP